MTGGSDWVWWVVAAAVAALFLWYFWHTGGLIFRGFRTVIGTIQNWPQTRRAMVEAEARSGGRYPLWLRALRVTLVLAAIGLAAFVIWRKLVS